MAKESSILKTAQHECVKRYYVYDADGFPTEIYEAGVDASNGDPALLTEQEWDNGKLIKSRESESTWSSSYDIT